jgi:hypothetical protein
MNKIFIAILFSISVSYSFAQPPNVYMTKYMDGPQNQNAIEIINKSGTAIDLSKIRLRTYYNGSTTASSPVTTVVADDAKTTMLANDQIFVFYFAGTGGIVKAATDLPNAPVTNRIGITSGGALGFNGNDAVTIECNTGAAWVMTDLIGCIGESPEANVWSKTISGKNITTGFRCLCRLPTVKTGVTTNPAIGTFDVSASWDLGYAGGPKAPYSSFGIISNAASK